MAFIEYGGEDQVDPADRIDDDDNILRIHRVHSRVMKLHYDLYVELLHRPSSLSRVQREMIATVVSRENDCHY